MLVKISEKKKNKKKKGFEIMLPQANKQKKTYFATKKILQKL